jgi:hypothetical protein
MAFIPAPPARITRSAVSMAGLALLFLLGIGWWCSHVGP